MRQMKDSRIEWIEGLPGHWKEIPNRYLFVDNSTKVGENWENYQLLSLTTSGVKQKDPNVGGGKVPESYETYQTVQVGDMVFCLFDLDCSAVFSGLSNYDGMITSAYDVFMPNGEYLDSLYADYWFQYVFSNRYYKMYSKNLRYTITSEMFKSIFTPIPSLTEQRKIGEFLLRKDKQIAELIANQQAQIEKLKEYKQSIITEAVTKGLDKSAPMKDSGIAWLGDIPLHWIKIKNKVLFKNVSIKGYGDATVLSLYRDHGVVPKDSRDDNHNVTSLDTDSYKYVQPDDLVINKMKAWSGSIAITDYEGIVSPAYYTCKVNYRYVDKRFIHHYLRNKHLVGVYKMYSAGLREGQWDLSIDDFQNIEIVVPPTLGEQIDIAKFIDDKCDRIDKLITLKQQKIEKLQEYKKSLIYEYVTGKKEVI